MRGDRPEEMLRKWQEKYDPPEPPYEPPHRECVRFAGAVGLFMSISWLAHLPVQILQLEGSLPWNIWAATSIFAAAPGLAWLGAFIHMKRSGKL